MTVLSTTKLTARRFLPMEDPPGARLELVDGEIAVSPSPMPRHSYAEKMLSAILLNHIMGHDLGELHGDVDTVFDESNVRRPDILFFRKERLGLIGEVAMEGPPDLCVEILSPSSATVDQVDKFELYQKHGVANYWIVDPKNRTIEGYALVKGKYQLAGSGRDQETVHLPPFMDLAIPLGRLWRKG